MQLVGRFRHQAVTETGPRQPPTPPPSGVVEPPEPSSDQAKVKFWRDRALQAEPRLVERDRQLQQQGFWT